MLSTEPSRPTYRHDIQGLRALAVLSVILFHINKDWIPGGFIGVDIFLVISGFLITSIILNKKSKKTFSFKGFYLSRFKRIVPAYLFLLLVTTLGMTVLLTPVDYKFYLDSLKHSLYFGSNLYFTNFGNYFAPNANEFPLLHTWSLAIEMQFYFILPFILILLPTKHLNKTIAFFVFFISLYTGYEIFIQDNKQDMYFSLLARSPEFLIGTFCALNETGKGWCNKKSNIASTIGIILLILSLIFIDESSRFPGLLALPACIGTALIISARRSKVNDFFSKPILVFIGTLSYSLYLWHWPVLSGIRYYTEQYTLTSNWIIFFATVTLAISYISYKAIESSSFFKGSNKKSIVALAWIFFPILILTGFSKFINRNIVSSPSDELSQYAEISNICHSKIVGNCIQGSISSESKILVIGDSHAAQLNIALDVIGKNNNIAFKVITSSSCVTIPKFDTLRLARWAQKPCLDQIDTIKQLLPHYDKVVLAGMWSYQTTSKSFIDALDSFLSESDRNKMDIYVLSQIPMLKSHPMRLQRFNELKLPTHILLDKEWQIANNIVGNIAQRYDNVKFIDVSDSPLFKSVPYFESELIYMDRSHLNENGSRLYGELMAERILRTIQSSKIQ